MQVSLDGGVTWQPADDGVRVTCNRVQVPGEDERGVLLFNFTQEGLITDLWVDRGDAEHNIGTSSKLYDDIIADLVEEGA